MATNREYLESLVERINDDVPMQDIIGRYVGEMKLQGGHYVALCPFHPDTTVGSFKVTPSKGVWKCFACETAGVGGISFAHRYLNDIEGKPISYKDTVFLVAREHGIISQEDYEKASAKRFSDADVESIRIKHEKQVKVKAPEKASPEICSMVYEAMLKVCPLTDAHIKHLTKERQLSPAQMKDYFSFPDARRNSMFLSKLKDELLERISMDETGKPYAEIKKDREARKPVIEKARALFDSVAYVPGFYRDKEGHNHWAIAHGIGIVVRNLDGNIVGMQIRRDAVKEGESRYIWFSSSFAQSMDGAIGGTSPGTPGGVIFPKKPSEHPAVCITEGRFKAEKIAEKGNVAVYVSGVSTWRSVVPYARSLSETYHVGNIFLMFDADMLGNVAVHKQLDELAEALRKDGLSSSLIIWRKDNGKGFDDLVIKKGGKYNSYLKRVNYLRFAAGYQDVLQSTLRTFGAENIHQLKPDMNKDFEATLQKNMETFFSLP